MGTSFYSQVWIGVKKKVFELKKGPIKKNYCAACEKEGIVTKHCPVCGTAIQKTYTEEIRVLTLEIRKTFTAKQIERIDSYDDPEEALHDEILFGKLQWHILDDGVNGEVLIGKCISDIDEENDGCEDITTSLPFGKVYEKLHKARLVASPSEVRYYHVFYCS